MEPAQPNIIPNPPDVDEPEPTPPELHYYVLQRGKIAGPFTILRIVEMAVARTVGRGDFIQITGSSQWRSLPETLNPALPPPEGTSPAPNWATTLHWAWLRLRYNLDEESLAAGCACLGIAAVGVLLSQWSLAFWGPLLIPPVIAAISLLRKKRYVAGALLITAVTLFPSLAKRWGAFAV